MARKDKIAEDLGFSKPRVNSQKKGKDNEANLANWLTRWTGYEFVRIPRSGGLRWKNTMNTVGDLLSTNPDFKWAFDIEAKSYNKISDRDYYKFWRQAKAQATKSGLYPSLWVRENGMPSNTWYFVTDIIMDLPHAFDIDGILWAYSTSEIIELSYKQFENVYTNAI
jgi:Holliday junction resolvase